MSVPRPRLSAISMGTGTPVLTPKLRVARPHTTFVARDRLLARLVSGLGRRMTLL